MPATKYTALKPHRDVASGRVLMPNDEIASESDLVAAFPGKFKLAGDSPSALPVVKPAAAESSSLPMVDTPAKAPAKTPQKP